MAIRLLTPLFILALCSCGPDSSEPSKASSPPAGKIPAALAETPALSGENALYHAAQLTGIGDRSPASPGYRKQLDYLKAALSKHGWQCQEQTFTAETPNGPVSFTNLRARTTNQFDAKPELLVTCHIDTKTGIDHFVGANDGASGAALILELARVMAQKPDLASKMEFVFFDGEESYAEHMTENDGLYGSSHYARELHDKLPKYLVNLDMVGRQGMKIRIPPDTPPILYDMYRDAVEQLKLPADSWGVAMYGILDDHIPFAKQGVIAINIIDDFRDGNWWHSSRDNLDILSASSFADSGQVALYLIERLLKG